VNRKGRKIGWIVGLPRLDVVVGLGGAYSRIFGCGQLMALRL
jgi:hypothetical protein